MPEIRARVSGAIELFGVPPKTLERLRQALSFPNPEYQNAVRFGRFVGAMPARISCLWETPDGVCRAPRGASDLIKKVLAKDGYTPAYADARQVGVSTGKPIVVPLRHYQFEAVEQLRKRLQGTIILPCGGGKTRLGVGVIGLLAVTALVIAHTDDLLDQWEVTIRQLLQVEPGVFNASRKELDRPIVIASIQSLSPFLDKMPGWADRFGLALLDECHHAPASTTQKVLLQIPARYRVGLTATPERADGLTPLMDWSFGPRLYEKTTKELVREGFLMQPDIEFLSTEFEFEFDDPENKNMFELDRALIADERRNAQIADRAADDAAAGEAVLVLSNRKDHCKILGKLIKARGINAHVLDSATKKTSRKDSIEQLRSGTVQVVVATSLADEGLDITRLSRVILAFPERSPGRTQQRTGRLMRVHEGKVPKLIDVVDMKVPTLKARFDARRRVYREMGLL